MKKVFTLLLLLLFLGLSAQNTITGSITDSATGTPLPFATLRTNDGYTVVGDVDGKFIIELSTKTSSFNVSYTGYKPQDIAVKDTAKTYRVKLIPDVKNLDELVINAENPANKIIRRAISRKKENDPQQKLESFRYKSYNRLVVTANPDSITGALDSIYIYEKAGRRFEKIDSSGFKFKKLIEKQHLYQTEKVSEYKFNKKQGLKETILATRMAGFKQPLYEIIGLTMQSYSVYGNNVEIIETKYEGPLGKSAFNDYHYRILDTVSIGSRMAYMVYFTPKRAKKKKRLDGVLYIDTENYGVAKSIFRVKNILDITSVHLFKYEESQKLWFPDKRSLKIRKGNNDDNVNILGETITFDATDKDAAAREKEASDFVYLLSEDENFDTEFNIPVEIHHPHVAIEIIDDAINRPEEYWNRFRQDSLDNRSITTYMALDSIVTKDNWEKRIILGRNIINGYLPIGFFNLDLRSVVKYNNYEGFRLGAGGITNAKFMETFRLGGYGAYGTKDGQFKYSLGGAVRVGKFSNSWIGASYTDDIKEIASTSFATDKRTFKIYDPRPINISTFYNHQTREVYLETKTLPKTESKWMLTQSYIDPKFTYLYSPDGRLDSHFNLTLFSVALQWNPFSDFMQTPTGKIENEKRYPKFAFQYTQAIKGVFSGDYSFRKIDFRTEYEKKFLNGQLTALVLQAGLATGDVPLTHLYSTSPNNLDKEKIWQRITFAGKNSFETMYFNEFFSSRYAMVQLKHGLKKFEVYDQIKLSPMVVTRAAWGNMAHPEDHLGLPFNTLEKGYYESGLELNEIFWGFGFSGFYRYGPYHLDTFERNISLKISWILKLGI